MRDSRFSSTSRERKVSKWKFHAREESNLNEQLVNDLKDSDDLDSHDLHGETPLLSALRSEHYEIAKLLIEAGSDIYLRRTYSRANALELIGKPSGIDKKNLMQLCLNKLNEDYKNDKQKVVKKLIDSNWPLENILQFHDVELTRIAMNHGYNEQIIPMEYSDQRSVLFDLVKNLDVDNLKVLLEHVEYKMVKDDNRQTIMSYVYKDSSLDNSDKKLQILTMLLEQTPIIERNDYDNLFTYADKEAIELILKHGIDFSTQKTRGETVIHCLARNLNQGVIEQLNSANFNINMRTRYTKQTPLMVAASAGNVNAVNIFLNLGAQIEATDIKNYTALFYAINNLFNNEQGRRQCIYALLERGANAQHITIPTHQTMFDFEINVSRVEILLAHLALLESNGTLIIELIRMRIDSKERFKNYYEQCKQQLPVKIYESVEILDLLVASDRKLECFSRNKEFLSKFQNSVDELVSSQYYKDVLKKRVSKATEMHELRYKAGEIICTIMEMDYDRFPVIADEISSYFNSQDMKNLIDAFI